MAFSTIPFHKQMREAVVSLLQSYKASTLPNLEIYPGRPIPLHPPHAFRESQSEDQLPAGINQRQRTIHAVWVVVWGLFDAGNTVIQRDDFVDGFTALVLQNAHQAGEQTELHVGPVEDIPNYVPEWLPEQVAYYATRITVEGFASG